MFNDFLGRVIISSSLGIINTPRNFSIKPLIRNKLISLSIFIGAKPPHLKVKVTSLFVLETSMERPFLPLISIYFLSSNNTNSTNSRLISTSIASTSGPISISNFFSLFRNNIFIYILYYWPNNR